MKTLLAFLFGVSSVALAGEFQWTGDCTPCAENPAGLWSTKCVVALQGQESTYITPKFTAEFAGGEANACRVPRFQASALLSTHVQLAEIRSAQLKLRVLNAQCSCTWRARNQIACTPVADLELVDSDSTVLARQAYVGNTGGKSCFVGSPARPRDCEPELEAQVKKSCEENSFGVLHALEQQTFMYSAP